MTLSYDQNADVMYIVFRPANGRVVYIETDEEAILRVEEETNTVVSVTIPYFSTRNEIQVDRFVPQEYSLPAGLVHA